MDRLLRLALPFIIYLVAAFIFSVAIMGVSFSAAIGFSSGDEIKTIVDMPLMLFGTLSVIYLFMWYKDHEQNGYEGNEMSKPMWLVLPLIGFAFAFGEIYAARGLLNKELSEVFFGVSEYAMDAVMALPTFFIAIFIVEPICFEFMFRGLLHQRLREESGAIAAIVVVGIVSIWFYRSVDMVLMSLILSFIYEYYRSLAAPIIVSVCYSLGCYAFYAISENLPGINGDLSILVPVLLLLSVVAIAFMLLMIYRKHSSPYGSKW
ncbi:MAG: CPBP family intramembrane metalloprotease [Lachnospiraceae bacterium]|nr:CPBP family intramembrane metalloprotease [Lachnospiraceae bacterium]